MAELVQSRTLNLVQCQRLSQVQCALSNWQTKFTVSTHERILKLKHKKFRLGKICSTQNDFNSRGYVKRTPEYKGKGLTVCTYLCKCICCLGQAD